MSFGLTQILRRRSDHGHLLCDYAVATLKTFGFLVEAGPGHFHLGTPDALPSGMLQSVFV